MKILDHDNRKERAYPLGRQPFGYQRIIDFARANGDRHFWRHGNAPGNRMLCISTAAGGWLPIREAWTPNYPKRYGARLP